MTTVLEHPAQATRVANPTQIPPARAKRLPIPIDAAPAQAIPRSNPTPPTPARADLQTIRILGELLDDLQQMRKANGNRIGAAERDRGSAIAALMVTQAALERIEHQAELELVRAWRKHPLALWAKGIQGLGEKSIARLIAIIGNPADRPNPAKLWAYCGVGEPTRKRRSGMTQAEAFQCGNPQARAQLYVITDAFVRSVEHGPRPASPYRVQYDARRLVTAERIHERDCRGKNSCGLPAGTPWRDSHKLADAKRVIGKRFLLDLWVAAQAIPASHLARETQRDPAGVDESFEVGS